MQCVMSMGVVVVVVLGLVVGVVFCHHSYRHSRGCTSSLLRLYCPPEMHEVCDVIHVPANHVTSCRLPVCVVIMTVSQPEADM